MRSRAKKHSKCSKSCHISPLLGDDNYCQGVAPENFWRNRKFLDHFECPTELHRRLVLNLLLCLNWKLAESIQSFHILWFLSRSAAARRQRGHLLRKIPNLHCLSSRNCARYATSHNQENYHLPKRTNKGKLLTIFSDPWSITAVPQSNHRSPTNFRRHLGSHFRSKLKSRRANFLAEWPDTSPPGSRRLAEAKSGTDLRKSELSRFLCNPKDVPLRRHRPESLASLDRFRKFRLVDLACVLLSYLPV